MDSIDWENASKVREQLRRWAPTHRVTQGCYTVGNLMPRARRGGFVLRRDEHPGQRTSANSISFLQDDSERPQSFCFRRASSSGRWGRWQQCSSRQRVGALSGAQRAGVRASCAAPNLLFPEMARNAKMRGFCYYGTRSRAASSRKTLTSKSGLPELAPLLSARSPVNPVASVLLPDRR